MTLKESLRRYEVKIVLDTNVLVSGIFWGGVPEKILEQAIVGEIQLYATESILDEYFRIIDKIGKKDKDLASQWKMLLVKIIKVIRADVKIEICRDPKDNMFLECAVASRAKYIVSGDDDLISLVSIEKTLIITAKEYLNTGS